MFEDRYWFTYLRSLFFLFQDVNFFHAYHTVPKVIVSANHSTKGENLSPVHNGITSWVEVGWILFYHTNSSLFSMCHQKFSVVPNNSIYDSTSYFPVRPSHSASTYTFSKYIWLMYYFFLLYSISTRLAFVFVLKNYMKPDMILLLLSTLSCQVNTWVLNFVTK